MSRHFRSVIAVAAVGLCLSFAGVAGPGPTSDRAVQQLQIAETAAREARLEGKKKPPREVGKANWEARKIDKKRPK
jgi:hypothetical protein